MKTKPSKTPKPNESKKSAKPTATAQAVPAAAVAKMTKWNEKHPEDTFSWVVIANDSPAAQKSCRSCKKEFGVGRITRLTSRGVFCGPRCQLKSSK